MLCPTPPTHDPARVRQLWPDLVKRVAAIDFPREGMTRRQFERLAFDWDSGWAAVPHEDRDHLLARLHRERFLSRVDVFDEIDRVYPRDMPRQAIHQAAKLKGDTPHRITLNATFKTITYSVERAYFWLTFKSAGASEGDVWEADRNIRHHVEEARAAVMAMLHKGVTLDDARLYLPQVFDPVMLERITLALPFLAQESTLAPLDVFPPPPGRDAKASPLERALAMLRDRGERGVKKSELRREIFSNNGAGFNALLSEIERRTDQVVRSPAKGTGGGRPAVFYVLRDGPARDPDEARRAMDDPFYNGSDFEEWIPPA